MKTDTRMLDVDYKDVIIDAGPENLEYEDYDSHKNEFTKKPTHDLCLFDRPPIVFFWGGMLGTVVTGILLGPAVGVICLGVGLTSLGVDACIQQDNDCMLPCIPRKKD